MAKLNFHTEHPSVALGFGRECCFTLGYSRDRMVHAVSQLSDDQIWWRPAGEMYRERPLNAAGNIVLHVCGNMRQWIVRTLGDLPDDRDRDVEFATREVVSGELLIAKLNATVDEACAAIMNADEAEWLRTRYVQIADVTGMGAVMHSVAHLEGHAQEMVYVARTLLGDGYRFMGEY